MMNILNYNLKPTETSQICTDETIEVLWSRDALGDLKHGLDLVFELKNKLDKLHPVARETLLRIIIW